MSHLTTLIKTNLQETLDTRSLKKNKGKTISFLAFISLVLIIAIIVSVIYNLMFVYLFKESNVNILYVALLFAGISSILILLTSIVRTKAIFISKDYDILRSMPIKKSDIILSKVFSLYLIELLYSSIIMIPNGIIISIFSNNIFYLFSGIIISIFLPFLPIVLGTLFGLLVTIIFDRFKYGNIISIVLYTIFFALIFFFSYKIGRMSNDEEVVNTIYKLTSFFKYLNPSLFLIELSFFNHWIYGLLFILSNIILGFLALFIISYFFDKVRTLTNSSFQSKKYNINIKNKGELKSLLQFEFKRYFSSKLYCINTISSGVVALLVVIGTITSLSSVNSQQDSKFLEYINYYAPFTSLIICFMIGITTPASSAISIEGKNMWFIKSLPINYKNYYKSKIILSTSVLALFTLVSSISLIIYLHPNILDSLFIIFIPIMYVFLVSCIGFRINLSFYKFNWLNEAEVVKNSKSVVISMLVSFLLVFLLAISIPIAIYNKYLALLYIFILLFSLDIIFYFVNNSIVTNKIYNMEINI